MKKTLQITLAFAAMFAAGALRADETPADTAPPHAKEGYATVYDKDGRLWIFRDGSPEHHEYLEKGKPAKYVTRPGAGPDGITLQSPDAETIVDYVVARPGFFTEVDKDGRLWVFRAGSEAHAEYEEKGKPAKHVVRPGVGPLGLTIKAVDTETIDAYLEAG